MRTIIISARNEKGELLDEQEIRIYEENDIRICVCGKTAGYEPSPKNEVSSLCIGSSPEESSRG